MDCTSISLTSENSSRYSRNDEIRSKGESKKNLFCMKKKKSSTRLQMTELELLCLLLLFDLIPQSLNFCIHIFRVFSRAFDLMISAMVMPIVMKVGCQVEDTPINSHEIMASQFGHFFAFR